ncbi:major facilitator superfamily domain-containing protein [Hyaloscypha finlandica]|nr:major facilitator superfamily domain-containing protein [Hyaloscypha finlandica]
MSGNEAALMVGNIDETSPQSQRPENSPTQDGTKKRSSLLFSPRSQLSFLLSRSICLPAPNPLVKDPNATASTINTSITVYIVVRGIAPTFIGSISDKNGRRPTFMTCYNTYSALLVLRCLQGSGVYLNCRIAVLGSAIVADIVTRAERGKWISYASVGVTLGPVLGRLIGGLLAHYLGWQLKTLAKRKRQPNPLKAVKIAFDKETGIILFSSALLDAGRFAVLAALPLHVQETYQFNTFQIDRCYIPYGLGSLIFRRHARRFGIVIVKNRQHKLSDFPTEISRLQISLPLVYLACLSMIAYEWVMNFKTNLAARSLSKLIIDINIESPATAAAASSLIRCHFGAGAVTTSVPLIDIIGMGWACTTVAGIWLAISHMLWLVFRCGHGWRE